MDMLRLMVESRTDVYNDDNKIGACWITVNFVCILQGQF